MSNRQVPPPGLTQQLDPLRPLIAVVVAEILKVGPIVTPLEVLVRLEIIEPGRVEAWRRGELPYLERGITTGLSRVGRLLRLLREQALLLGLEPTHGKYQRRGKGKRQPLRFSKRGDAETERLYTQHYLRAQTNAAHSAAAASAADEAESAR
jgi:hypothetical protein